MLGRLVLSRSAQLSFQAKLINQPFTKRSTRICFRTNMASSFTGTCIDDLSAWLTSVGIDPQTYGQNASKPLDLLLTEVEEGESTLTISEDGSPLRLVNVMNVIVRNTQDKSKTLIEARQILPTGATRCRNLPLAEKLLPNERWQDAVLRAVQEELGPILGDTPQIAVDQDSYEKRVETRESQSYPGLPSKYTCHRVEATVAGLPNESFTTTEERSDGTLVHCWEWQ